MENGLYDAHFTSEEFNIFFHVKRALLDTSYPSDSENAEDINSEQFISTLNELKSDLRKKEKSGMNNSHVIFSVQ